MLTEPAHTFPFQILHNLVSLPDRKPMAEIYKFVTKLNITLVDEHPLLPLEATDSGNDEYMSTLGNVESRASTVSRVDDL